MQGESPAHYKQLNFKILTIMKKNTYKTKICRPIVDKGESIEEMIRRQLANNEPMEAISPMIYTEKKDGVLPQYNIRTDRFDTALDATDKLSKSVRARSDENPFQPPKEEKNETSKNE